MKIQLRILASFTLAIIVTSSCSDSKTTTQEKQEISVMDSSKKAVKEKIDKLEAQTKKVEESLEKLDKEFEEKQ